MSMEVPVVTKNKPRSKPLNGLISASICVRKFVSARSAPARKAPSFRVRLNEDIRVRIVDGGICTLKEKMKSNRIAETKLLRKE